MDGDGVVVGVASILYYVDNIYVYSFRPTSNPSVLVTGRCIFHCGSIYYMYLEYDHTDKLNNDR